MSEESRVDPAAQIDQWLRQYCAHVKVPEVAKKIDQAAIFRLTRTMFEQGKDLKDVQEIIADLAKSGRKPKGVGWIITVIEGQLGKVA